LLNDPAGICRRKEVKMKVNAKKVMEKAAGASTGVAVAAAFFNIALILVQLVKTVSEEAPKLEDKE